MAQIHETTPSFAIEPRYPNISLNERIRAEIGEDIIIGQLKPLPANESKRRLISGIIFLGTAAVSPVGQMLARETIHAIQNAQMNPATSSDETAALSTETIAQEAPPTNQRPQPTFREDPLVTYLQRYMAERIAPSDEELPIRLNLITLAEPVQLHIETRVGINVRNFPHEHFGTRVSTDIPTQKQLGIYRKVHKFVEENGKKPPLPGAFSKFVLVLTADTFRIWAIRANEQLQDTSFGTPQIEAFMVYDDTDGWIVSVSHEGNSISPDELFDDVLRLRRPKKLWKTSRKNSDRKRLSWWKASPSSV